MQVRSQGDQGTIGFEKKLLSYMYVGIVGQGACHHGAQFTYAALLTQIRLGWGAHAVFLGQAVASLGTSSSLKQRWYSSFTRFCSLSSHLLKKETTKARRLS